MNYKRMSHAPKRKAHSGRIDLIDEDGVFEGYAAVFNVEDLSRDIIMPGAFALTLMNNTIDDIKLLYQHQPSELIGCWMEIREDPQGLYVRGRILTDLIRGREVLSLMRAGVLDGLSIGFHAVKANRDHITGVRALFEIELWEISLVTFPMQQGARIHSVKFEKGLADTIWQVACRLGP